MKKIIPHLWFDKEAAIAADFYMSLFEGSKLKSKAVLNDTPSGTAELLTIEIAGQDFMLISAGPYFKFTPAISFLIACNTIEEADLLWEKLCENGEVLMPYGEYPYSKKYGWVADRFGLSWQVMHVGEQEIKQKITPTLMFVREVCGKTEEAINYYVETFEHSFVESILRYEKTEGPDQEGTITHVEFTLENQRFAAMDSAYDHEFGFNEAVSLVVKCDSQEEIDYFWGKLSAVPEAEQCGWLKDRFGVSWQIVPSIMDSMMKAENPEKIAKVTEAFLKMKKFNIAELIKAYEG